MKKFALGDVHAGYKALLQCLERANFDYDNAKLICLGDVADGWVQAPECFDELLKIKNLVYVIGNHDSWLLDWFQTGYAPHIWLSQGGSNTLASYQKLLKDGDTTKQIQHQNLLESASYYHVEDNKLFVHGGFDWKKPIEEQDNYDLTWDRHLWGTVTYWKHKGLNHKIKDYEEVFIGHTSTSHYQPDLLPAHASNVWNIDQGGGWEGKLTLIDIDTHQHFQSDIVSTLYPDVKGR